MQSEFPTLKQIEQRKRLKVQDAGRALFYNMIASTQVGENTPLPQNVAVFLNNMTQNEALIFARYSNALYFIAQYRAVADTHLKRLAGYLAMCTGILETATAMELLMSDISSLPGGDEKLAVNAEWRSYGLDRFSAAGGTVLKDSIIHDRELALSSTSAIAGYNTAIELIAEELHIPELIIVKLATDLSDIPNYNRTVEKALRVLQSSAVEGSQARLRTAEQLFLKFPELAEVKVDPEKLETAKNALKELEVFSSPDGRFADILMNAREV